MHSAFAIAVLLGLGASPITARQTQHAEVTPIQKVLQMMGDMKNKALKEKKDEIVMMTTFNQWCKNTDENKAKAIEEGKQQADQLAADIVKYNSDAKVAGEEIEKLGNSISLAESDKATATELREKEHADYEKTHAEYVENIDDLGVAMTKIKAMMDSGPGKASFSLLQKLATSYRMPEHAKRVITAFLAQGSSTAEEGIEVQAPEGAVYESQSGGIMQMMEQLDAKLADEKAELEKEESNARHAFDMMAQSLTDKIEQETATRTKKTSDKNKAESASAQAQGELEDTKNTLAEDTKYLEDLKIMCETKNAEFETAQKVRADELEALDEAIEIISSGSVSGAGEKHLPGALLQRPTALAQLRSKAQAPAQEAVAAFLASQGEKFNSRILSALAVRAGADPFKKISKMIKDMIIKLNEEATEEAEHKGFCDTELATNKQTRDLKTSESDELTANIEEMTAESQKHAVDIAELNDQVSAIDAAVAKATSIRNEEKTKNTQTIADAKEAKTAVAKALTVLKTFYDGAKSPGAAAALQTGPIQYDDRAIAMLKPAAALVQGPMDDSPASVSKPYTGGESGGILGMLEVIISDFERLESETTETENTAQNEYDAFMADSQEDKAVKNADIKHKTSRKQRLDSDTMTAKRDLKSTQEELAAALAYYEKLKPSCVDAGETYEERVQRRKDEIQSLNEALKILSGDSV